jgi:TRAP transporter TAXI family solute receptor
VVLNDGPSLRVVPVVGMGGVQNIRDVRSLKGIDIGFTQSNILNSFRLTNKEQVGVDQNKIVYIANLFNEEVHLIARQDITSISQLRGQKVNLDVPGSGTAFTMRDIFKSLGVDVEEVNLDQAEALEKMKTGEIAATVLVAGKPVTSIQNIPKANGFHILPIPFAPALQERYLPDQFSSDDYPDLVAEGATVDTVAVSAVLIAYNWPKESDRYQRVKTFVEALFKKFDGFMKSSRHPKWRNVNLASSLPGWDRFDVAETLLAEQTTASISTRQASFETFLEGRGLVATTTADEREKLFNEFMKWSETRQ